ncbi:hypothetical protein [Pseudomonas sp. NPDC088444]|uniref:hypothetical protein n=1 Tax=Pseudomonas sp. NPDC088444 TaxID=3364456 RepID=UPI00384D8F72
MWRFKRTILASMILVLGAESQLSHATAPDLQQGVPKSREFKYGLVESVSESHMDGEIVLTDLSDQIHVLQNRLVSSTAAHYYTFTATRGQRVLLSYPNGLPQTSFKVEYLSGNKWEPLVGGSKTFSGLGAAGSVIARVVSGSNASDASTSYKIVFGSFPVLKKYELKDEVGVNRIPTGHTHPSWLWTQGYNEANLEAHFTDSVGAPLKGAMGRFILNLQESRVKTVVEEVISGGDGKIEQVVRFDRCSGGHEARDYVSYDRGANTWRSYYYVGGYTFLNALLGAEAQAEANADVRLFGHICKSSRV